jgi:hypothetical protein
MELEKQLKKIEEGIKVFSRPKVFVNMGVWWTTYIYYVEPGSIWTVDYKGCDLIIKIFVITILQANTYDLLWSLQG